jgi:hypothetical protein
VLSEGREVDDNDRRRIAQAAQLVAAADELHASEAVEVSGVTWQIVSVPELLRSAPRRRSRRPCWSA